MKTQKKVFSLITALIMVMSMTMTSLAETLPDSGNDIFIENVTDGDESSDTGSAEEIDDQEDEEIPAEETDEEEKTEEEKAEEESEEHLDESFLGVQQMDFLDNGDEPIIITINSGNVGDIQEIINAFGEDDDAIEIYFIITEDIRLEEEIRISKEEKVVYFLTADENPVVIEIAEAGNRHFVVEEEAGLSFGDEENSGSFILDGKEIAGGIEVYGSVYANSSMVIQNCVTDNDGGGIALVDNGHMVFEIDCNVTIENCSAVNGGGIFMADVLDEDDDTYRTLYFGESVLTINNCSADQNGGGIYIGGNSNLGAADVEITNCTAKGSGGGIYLEKENHLFAHALTIDTCTAGINGGGIYIGKVNTLSAEILIVNSCTAGANGGGIYILQSVGFYGNAYYNISYCTAESGNGGGIYAIGSHINLSSCGESDKKSELSYNKALNGNGGGMYIEATEEHEAFINIASSQLHHNESLIGGAMYILGLDDEDTDGQVYFSSCGNDIYQNTAVTGGGAIRAIGKLTFVSIQSESNIYGNEAKDTQSYGGALWLENCELQIGESIIADNKAGTGGGICYEITSNADISMNIHTDSVVRGNTATFNGGGLAVINSASKSEEFGVMIDCIFENNQALYGNGGGVYIQNTGSGGGDNNTTIDVGMGEGKLTGNSAGIHGGGLYSYSAGEEITSVGISDSVVEKNTAGRDGGGVYMATVNDKLQVFESEFTDNAAGGHGGAIFSSDFSTPIAATDFSNINIDYYEGTQPDDPMSQFKGNKASTYISDTIDFENLRGTTTSLEAEGIAPGYSLVNNYDINTGASAETVRIIFNPNGGTPVPAIQLVAVGDKVSAPVPAPTKDGFTLEGWYTDNDTFKNKWNFDVDTATNDMTLYANWNANNPGTSGGSGGGEGSLLFVKFDPNGGSPAPATQSVRSGSKAKMPEDNPAREGFEFLGWYTTQSCTQLYDFDLAVTKSITLYAGWKAQDEGVHFPYIFGYPDGTFKADANATRAEMAQILFALSAPYSPNGVGAPFNDVRDASMWAYQPINYIASQGVVSGYPGGSFQPSGKITRAEFVSMVVRFMGENGQGTPQFPDVSASHWAAGYIAAAQNEGILSGYPDGTFRPDDYISRAEIVVIMNRVMDRIPVSGMFNIDNIPSDDVNQAYWGNIRNPFIDLNQSYWGYDEIMEAATEHNTH